MASSGISLFRMAASPMMAGAVRFFLMLMSFADISRAPAIQASDGVIVAIALLSN